MNILTVDTASLADVQTEAVEVAEKYQTWSAWNLRKGRKEEEIIASIFYFFHAASFAEKSIATAIKVVFVFWYDTSFFQKYKSCMKHREMELQSSSSSETTAVEGLA